MTEERDRIIDYLERKGHDRDFATHIVDNEQNSLTYQAARLNTAFLHLVSEIGKPLLSIVDRLRR